MDARQAKAVVGSLLFFVVAPGTFAGYVPFRITRWRMQAPLFGVRAFRAIGAALIAIGLLCLVECFARFALKGRGTPAPLAPPETLVVSGLYRYVRNPMYLSVAALAVGQALLLGHVALLAYACAALLVIHLFVIAYEEPTLERQFGAQYAAYRSGVRRWWPRTTPWRMDTHPESGEEMKPWADS
jgi:protein-S-isoprenylcysteine O-methyltransferase Ste14